MMNAEAFSHILRVAGYLDIAEKHDYLQDFFSRVCRHNKDIPSTRLYELQSGVENVAYTKISGSF